MLLLAAPPQPLLLPARVPSRVEVGRGFEVDTVTCADALDFLRGLPDGSVNAVITDPICPGAIRDYGEITEDAWLTLMKGCVIEIKRALRPNGSCVLIVQPNSQHVGQMRSWVWDFMSWACRFWNIIQDVYWWNYTPFPTVHSHRTNGLMRPSVKYCIWLGNSDCYRNQDAVLWRASEAMKGVDLSDRALHKYPSGGTKRPARTLEVVLERGGSTPINLLPISNANSTTSGGAFGHGASTPDELMSWWVRYITQPGALICDPFMGSGTIALMARKLGRHYIGADLSPKSIEQCTARLAQPYTIPMMLDI